MLGAAVLLQAAMAAGVPQVGVILAVDDPGARLVLRESLERQLASQVSWSCREAQVCLELVAVPIVAGKNTTGWAVAARLSRRLQASPQWPRGEPGGAKTPGAAVEIIEDTTASGELACAPCEETKSLCQRRLSELESFARERFEDLGGLFLRVGPAQDQFLRQAAQDVVARMLEELGQGGEP